MGLVDRDITKEVEGMDNKGGKIGPLKSRGKLYLVIVGKRKRR